MFAADSEMPIAVSLVPLGYFGLFIGLILKLIISTLFLLSIMMMNNTLLMGVERRGFDFALMKTLGASVSFVAWNILADSLGLVFIANVVAYPFAYFFLGSVSSFS